LLHVSKNLRDTVSKQHLAKMGFLRDNYLVPEKQKTG